MAISHHSMQHHSDVPIFMKFLCFVKTILDGKGEGEDRPDQFFP